jgi:hypothetical protein
MYDNIPYKSRADTMLGFVKAAAARPGKHAAAVD